MGKRSVASSFFSGLAGGLEGTARQLGASYWQGRQLADQARKGKEREAVRVAERKQLMDIQAANQKSNELYRRVGMLPQSQRTGAYSAGLEGLTPEVMQEFQRKGDERAAELSRQEYDRQRALLGMKLDARGGRFADASRKAPYASFQNATRTLEGISKKLLQDLDSTDKQLENTFLRDEERATLQGQRNTITDRLRESNNSRMYNSSLMSRAITGDVPSQDELSIGVKMFLQSQGLDHQNPEVFDNSALTLLYARYRPEMIAAEKQPAVREQKQDNQPAFNYRWREPK